MWRLIAKALGQKDGKTDAEANIIASIRLSVVIVSLIANIMIIASVIRHWNK